MARTRPQGEGHQPLPRRLTSLRGDIAHSCHSATLATSRVELGRGAEELRHLVMQNREVLGLHIQGNQHVTHHHLGVETLAQVLVEVGVHRLSDGGFLQFLLSLELEKVPLELGDGRLVVDGGTVANDVAANVDLHNSIS